MSDEASNCSRDAVLVAALLTGATLDDAARVAGVSRSTAWRRAQDTAVRAELDRRRAEVLDRAADVLAAEALASVRVLAAIRDDDGAPPSVRRAAARDLLSVSLDFRNSVELAARVTALETALTSRVMQR